MRKLDRNILIFFILIAFILLFLPIILSILDGISWVQPWHLAIFYLPLTLVVYQFFKDKYKGLKTFLGLMLFSFMFYPTLSFYMYEFDRNNYRISDEYLILESNLAHEKLKNKISLDDLFKIRSKIINQKLQYPTKVLIPDTINLIYKNVGSINNPSTKVLITKSDTLSTTFTYSLIPPKYPQSNPSPGLILGLDQEIKNFERLNAIKKMGNQNIPFSEFWIESVLSFSSGHIMPLRNLPKILNALQILSMLFISTILINTVGAELKLEKRKK